MKLCLEIMAGPLATRQLWLGPAEARRVGRTSVSDWVIPHDAELSGQHFLIECTATGTYVVDLDSTNGTYLNGTRVLKAAVAEGDILTAGTTQFRVAFSDSGDAVPDSPTPASILPNPPPVPGAELAVASRHRHRRRAVVMPPRPPISPPDLPHASVEPWSIVPETTARPYRTAFQDSDPTVRREALYAAAWNRQPWLLDFCRRMAHAPLPPWESALYLFGVLATDKDLDSVIGLGRMQILGPHRFRVLGAYGHPRTIEYLLEVMRTGDVPDVMAAGEAFRKILGVEIDAPQGRTSHPSEPAPAEGQDQGVETGDNLVMPDAVLAQQLWHQMRGTIERRSRWCRGTDMSQAWNDTLLSRLDLESRWEFCLRGRYHGTWAGDPAPLIKSSPWDDI